MVLSVDRGSTTGRRDGPAGGLPRATAGRRGLPNGRAVVGGFLVAAAVVGVFAAYSGASRAQGTTYVVAASNLQPGHRIVANDLAGEKMRLPGPLGRDLSFRDPGELVGTVVVAPIRAGELVQAGDVSRAGAGTRQISFSIDPARAVDGTLQPGDRVDVLVTYGTGSDATTSDVANGVAVVAVDSGSSSLTGNQAQVITLALADPVDPLALAQAINTGEILLVRSTGASSGASSASGSGAYVVPSTLPGDTTGTGAG